ncbi:MAG: energy transducer TonB [Candidatus Omnitrophica bacterium]|nr:energy transducer TonB [Candidatus Omnitrophota bacterium]MCB9721439.1 energy transducer TonB [Candidatus Omnitrophota bacterium]
MRPARLSSGNWFYPILTVSLCVHLLFVWRAHAVYQAPEFAVPEAPSSISVSIVRTSPPIPPVTRKREAAASPETSPLLTAQLNPAQEMVVPTPLARRFERVPPEPATSLAADSHPDPERDPPAPWSAESVAEADVALSEDDAAVDPMLSADESAGALSRAKPLAAQNSPPAYPALAMRRGWEGTVRLSVEVSAAGTVEQVTIAESSGHALLDRSARQTVETWQFQPALRGNRNAASVVTVPVEFRLKDRL